VSEERAAAKLWKDAHDDLHRDYTAMMDMAMMDKRSACQDKVMDNLVL
jgi:hypothetical protein